MRTRPVVVCAYGDESQRWLEDSFHACLSSADVAELVARQRIQFWLVSAGLPEVCDGVRLVRPDNSPVQLRALLDAGLLPERGAGHNYLRPLFVDRWSLFRPGALFRHPFRSAVRIACKLNADPSQPPELYHEWITLADTVRPNAPLSLEAQRGLKEQLATAPDVDAKVFLVDRKTSAGALLLPVHADRVHAELLECILSAGLAFHDAADGSAPAWFTEPWEAGTVAPVSVLVLEHTPDRLLELVSDDLQFRLVRPGPLESATVLRSNGQRLADVVVRDLGPGQGPLTDAGMSLAGRTAIEDLIRRAIASKDLMLLGEIREARESLWAGRATDNPANQGAILAVLPIVDGGTLGALIVAALGVGVVASLLWRRKPPPAVVQTPAGMERPVPVTCGAQWSEQLDRLEELVRWWNAATPSASTPSEPQWIETSTGPPDTWTLKKHPAAGTLREVETEVYDRLARDCAGLLGESDGPASAVASACRREAARTMATPSQVTDLLATALDNGLRQLQQIIASQVLLADAGEIIPVAAVHWSTARVRGVAARLLQLEHVSNLTPVTVGDLCRTDKSVRLAVGRPLPWERLLSMSFLKSHQ